MIHNIESLQNVDLETIVQAYVNLSPRIFIYLPHCNILLIHLK
jgi:hypothetical protein